MEERGPRGGGLYTYNVQAAEMDTDPFDHNDDSIFAFPFE